MTTDLVPARITEKRLLLRLAGECFLAKNPFFFVLKKRNLLKDRYLFGKRVLFCLHNFSRPWLKHGLSQEVNVLFLGPLTFCFCKKKRLTRQKVFPHPTVGAMSVSNTLALLTLPHHFYMPFTTLFYP